MLNEESRKYFNRAYIASSSALNFHSLRRFNHTKTVQKCSQLENIDEIIAHIKTASADILGACNSTRSMENILLTWVPTVEPAGAIRPFLDATPEQIYNSNNAPVMDALFSFTSQVFIQNIKCVSHQLLLLFVN